MLIDDSEGVGDGESRAIPRTEDISMPTTSCRVCACSGTERVEELEDVEYPISALTSKAPPASVKDISEKEAYDSRLVIISVCTKTGRVTPVPVEPMAGYDLFSLKVPVEDIVPPVV